MATPFLVGHHDSKRDTPISSTLISQAHAANYDMLTFPITNSHFHSRVLSVLSSAFSNDNASTISVQPLTPSDTQLTPDESISSIVGITSPWIDLGSPDPIVADVSRQVLRLELAYAAFCGVSYVIIYGPRQNNSCDVAAYARAILNGLEQGPYMQLYLWTNTHPEPTNAKEEMGDLINFARQEHVLSHASEEDPTGVFQTWQAWDTIRSICKYSTRLNIALSLSKTLPPPALLSRWYSEPIRIVTLDKEVFQKNAKGYPALYTGHREYLLRLMKLKVQPWLLMCDGTPLKA